MKLQSFVNTTTAKVVLFSFLFNNTAGFGESPSVFRLFSHTSPSLTAVRLGGNSKVFLSELRKLIGLDDASHVRSELRSPPSSPEINKLKKRVWENLILQSPDKQMKLAKQIWEGIDEDDMLLVARVIAQDFYDQDQKGWLYPAERSAGIKRLYPAIMSGNVNIEMAADYAQIKMTVRAELRKNKVPVLGAGGTIDMLGEVGRHAEEMVRPILSRLHASVQYEKVFDEAPDSSNVEPEDWEKIIDRIKKVISQGRSLKTGVVLTSGTDRLSELAFVLSQEFSGKLTKPLILTAAFAPVDVENSDAEGNLAKAIRLAKNKNLPNEVYALIGNELHLASRIEKVQLTPNGELFRYFRTHGILHTTDGVDGKYFASYGDPIATVDNEGAIIFKASFLKWAAKRSRAPSQVHEKKGEFGYVEHVVFDHHESEPILKDGKQVNPYTPVQVLMDAKDRLIKIAKIEKDRRVGLLIEGNFSKSNELKQIHEVIQTLIAHQIPVIVTYQANLDSLKQFGPSGVIVKPHKLSAMKARTKLSWLLRQGFSFGQLSVELKRDYAGEIDIPKWKRHLPGWAHERRYYTNDFRQRSEFLSEGQEVVVSFPGMYPDVIRDAVKRFRDQYARTGKKPYYLLLYGYGNGHFALVNKSIQKIVFEYLEKNQSKSKLLSKFFQQYENVTKSSSLELHTIQELLTNWVSEQSPEDSREFFKDYQFSPDDSESGSMVKAWVDGYLALSQSFHRNSNPIMDEDRLLEATKKWPTLLANRILQDAMMDAHPVLKLLGDAADEGIIETYGLSRVVYALPDLDQYEVGQMLRIVGVGMIHLNRVHHRSWRNPIVPRKSRAELRNLKVGSSSLSSAPTFNQSNQADVYGRVGTAPTFHGENKGRFGAVLGAKVSQAAPELLSNEGSSGTVGPKASPNKLATRAVPSFNKLRNGGLGQSSPSIESKLRKVRAELRESIPPFDLATQQRKWIWADNIEKKQLSKVGFWIERIDGRRRTVKRYGYSEKMVFDPAYRAAMLKIEKRGNINMAVDVLSSETNRPLRPSEHFQLLFAVDPKTQAWHLAASRLTAIKNSEIASMPQTVVRDYFTGNGNLTSVQKTIFTDFAHYRNKPAYIFFEYGVPTKVLVVDETLKRDGKNWMIIEKLLETIELSAVYPQDDQGQWKIWKFFWRQAPASAVNNQKPFKVRDRLNDSGRFEFGKPITRIQKYAGYWIDAYFENGVVQRIDILDSKESANVIDSYNFNYIYRLSEKSQLEVEESFRGDITGAHIARLHERVIKTHLSEKGYLHLGGRHWFYTPLSQYANAPVDILIEEGQVTAVFIRNLQHPERIVDILFLNRVSDGESGKLLKTFYGRISRHSLPDSGKIIVRGIRKKPSIRIFGQKLTFKKPRLEGHGFIAEFDTNRHLGRLEEDDYPVSSFADTVMKVFAPDLQALSHTFNGSEILSEIMQLIEVDRIDDAREKLNAAKVFLGNESPIIRGISKRLDRRTKEIKAFSLVRSIKLETKLLERGDQLDQKEAELEDLLLQLKTIEAEIGTVRHVELAEALNTKLEKLRKPLVIKEESFLAPDEPRRVAEHWRRFSIRKSTKPIRRAELRNLKVGSSSLSSVLGAKVSRAAPELLSNEGSSGTVGPKASPSKLATRAELRADLEGRHFKTFDLRDLEKQPLKWDSKAAGKTIYTLKLRGDDLNGRGILLVVKAKLGKGKAKTNAFSVLARESPSHKESGKKQAAGFKNPIALQLKGYQDNHIYRSSAVFLETEGLEQFIFLGRKADPIVKIVPKRRGAEEKSQDVISEMEMVTDFTHLSMNERVQVELHFLPLTIAGRLMGSAYHNPYQDEAVKLPYPREIQFMSSVLPAIPLDSISAKFATVEGERTALDIPVTILDLSDESSEALKLLKIETLSQLVAITEFELLTLPRYLMARAFRSGSMYFYNKESLVKESVISDIKQSLSSRGLHFKEMDEDLLRLRHFLQGRYREPIIAGIYRNKITTLDGLIDMIYNRPDEFIANSRNAGPKTIEYLKGIIQQNFSERLIEALRPRSELRAAFKPQENSEGDLSSLVRNALRQDGTGTKVAIAHDTAVWIDDDYAEANIYQIVNGMWKLRRSLYAARVDLADGISYQELSQSPEFPLNEPEVLALTAIGKLFEWWDLKEGRFSKINLGALGIGTLFGDSNLESHWQVNLGKEDFSVVRQAVMEEEGVSFEELIAAVRFWISSMVNDGIFESEPGVETASATQHFRSYIRSKLGNANYEMEVKPDEYDETKLHFSVYKTKPDMDQDKEYANRIVLAQGVAHVRAELRNIINRAALRPSLKDGRRRTARPEARQISSGARAELRKISPQPAVAVDGPQLTKKSLSADFSSLAATFLPIERREGLKRAVVHANEIPIPVSRAEARQEIRRVFGLPTVDINTKLVVAISRFVFADDANKETLGPILHQIAEVTDESIVLFGAPSEILQAIADAANIGLDPQKQIQVAEDYRGVKGLFADETKKVQFHVIAAENDPLKSDLQAELFRGNLGEVTYLKQGDMKSLLRFFRMTEAMLTAYRAELRLAEAA